MPFWVCTEGEKRQVQKTGALTDGSKGDSSASQTDNFAGAKLKAKSVGVLGMTGLWSWADGKAGVRKEWNCYVGEGKKKRAAFAARLV
jgi:hypothetical protein